MARQDDGVVRQGEKLFPDGSHQRVEVAIGERQRRGVGLDEAEAATLPVGGEVRRLAEAEADPA